MCRVIDQVGDYKILKASRSYIVKNVKGEYSNHGHFTQLKTCYLIIKLIRKRQVPRSKYLRGAALRISTDKDYVNKVKRKIEKDRNKQKYININKGCRQIRRGYCSISLRGAGTGSKGGSLCLIGVY